MKADKDYSNLDVSEENKVRDVYIPFWAKTMIDLYTSFLKDAGVGDMQIDDRLS